VVTSQTALVMLQKNKQKNNSGELTDEYLFLLSIVLQLVP